MPTFMPLLFATSATDSRRFVEGPTPSLPLSVFAPQAIAVAAAAESVIMELALFVLVFAW